MCTTSCGVCLRCLVVHNVDLIRIDENVQRRFTKRLPGCSQLSYSRRLAKLDLNSLELRRLNADLTYAYKIMFGLVDVSCVDTFSTCNSRTRGHWPQHEAICAV